MTEFHKIEMGQARIEAKIDAIHATLKTHAEILKHHDSEISEMNITVHGLENDKKWSKAIVGALFAVILGWLGLDRR